jgi:hypothetical protein
MQLHGPTVPKITPMSDEAGTMLFIIGPPAVGKMTVGEGRLDGPDHLHLDNTHLAPAEVARRVIAHFGLP